MTRACAAQILYGARRGGPAPALTATTGGRPPRARLLRDRRHHAPQPGAHTSHGVPGHGSPGNRRQAIAPPHVPRPARPATPAVAGEHDGRPELRRPRTDRNHAPTAPGPPQADLPQPPETRATHGRSQVLYHRLRQHPHRPADWYRRIPLPWAKHQSSPRASAGRPRPQCLCR